jgi:hypothetical protein
LERVRPWPLFRLTRLQLTKGSFSPALTLEEQSCQGFGSRASSLGRLAPVDRPDVHHLLGGVVRICASYCVVINFEFQHLPMEFGHHYKTGVRAAFRLGIAEETRPAGRTFQARKAPPTPGPRGGVSQAAAAGSGVAPSHPIFSLPRVRAAASVLGYQIDAFPLECCAFNIQKKSRPEGGRGFGAFP